MNPIKSQIEEVEKEIEELKENRIRELSKGFLIDKNETTEHYRKRLEVYFNEEKNDDFDYPDIALPYRDLNTKLQTLKSLEPLFEKMEKEIETLQSENAKLKKKLDDFKKEIDKWWKKMQKKREIYTDPQIVDDDEIIRLKQKLFGAGGSE